MRLLKNELKKIKAQKVRNMKGKRRLGQVETMVIEGIKMIRKKKRLDRA